MRRAARERRPFSGGGQGVGRCLPTSAASAFVDRGMRADSRALCLHPRKTGGLAFFASSARPFFLFLIFRPTHPAPPLSSRRKEKKKTCISRPPTFRIDAPSALRASVPAPPRNTHTQPPTLGNRTFSLLRGFSTGTVAAAYFLESFFFIIIICCRRVAAVRVFTVCRAASGVPVRPSVFGLNTLCQRVVMCAFCLRELCHLVLRLTRDMPAAFLYHFFFVCTDYCTVRRTEVTLTVQCFLYSAFT